jgi:hypothetical protein
MADKKVVNKKPTEDMFNYLPIGGDSTSTYSPKEIPTKLRPTFTIKQMTQGDRAEYSKIKLALIGASDVMAKKVYEAGKTSEDIDSMIDDLDIFDNITRAGNRIGDIMRKHILGWKKFKSMDGKPFEFECDDDGVLSVECYAKIPPALQSLVVDRIVLISGLSAEESTGLKS